MIFFSIIFTNTPIILSVQYDSIIMLSPMWVCPFFWLLVWILSQYAIIYVTLSFFFFFFLFQELIHISFDYLCYMIIAFGRFTLTNVPLLMLFIIIFFLKVLITWYKDIHEHRVHTRMRQHKHKLLTSFVENLIFFFFGGVINKLFGCLLLKDYSKVRL